MFKINIIQIYQRMNKTTSISNPAMVTSCRARYKVRSLVYMYADSDTLLPQSQSQCKTLFSKFKNFEEKSFRTTLLYVIKIQYLQIYVIECPLNNL